ncbi:transporter substrate-binding domain-containing protein [Shewanella sedimentimangrovi]|uniref:Transporter substrate-binding domain-containing protein n=2 Tax=Shewanella sedimentimangrovi TaxID=2814293 RepID=A0ABX7R7B1_9GAMM|nr:transporter substrate-binding domain-containing protein [Shewanella sedimentimangrovi]
MLSGTHADELTIGVSFSIPPYVIQENNTGLELELLNMALADAGHRVNITYLPLARTFHELREGKLDGIINVHEGMVDKVFYSDVAIVFQNCAISLAKNQLKIDSIRDLKDKRIVAFQRASVLLGPEFSQVVTANDEYSEVARQLLQVYMLMKDRVDAVVMDRHIFNYYRRQALLQNALNATELQQSLVYHEIFPPTEYRFAFQSERIRDDFNRGLKQLKADGRWQQLHEKYQDDMPLVSNPTRPYDAAPLSLLPKPMEQEVTPASDNPQSQPGAAIPPSEPEPE